MLDPRAKKLAEIVVDYSTEINPKDTLLIQSEDAFKEFAEEIARQAIQRGAYIFVEFKNINKEKEMIERSCDSELDAESKRLCKLAETSTARIRIDASEDPLYLQGVPSEKIAKYSEMVSKPFLDRITGNGKEFKGLKWNLVAYPSEADAKVADMPLEKYANFVFGATNIDWKEKRGEMKRIKGIFDNAKDVHIMAERTSLHLSLEGRGTCICDGKYNMPDGEVYAGPLENSANGYIYFPYPTIRDGNLVRGVWLKYKDGEVIDFSAKKNQKFLESMLGLEGVKRIGEFGIGCNYGIERYTTNLLFDEKIGGTIHLALGESYKEPLDNGGGLNEAKIHWDLVCDLRMNGEIYVNDKLVQKNGIWVFDK